LTESPSSRTTQTATVAQWVIVAVGVGLRLVAWLGRSTMWTDEVALSRNVVERSLGDLLAVPLDYHQAAPKGFLLLQWIVWRTLGSGDAQLRLLAFVAGIASLLLFRRVARRLLPDVAAVAALFFFALGQWFVLYSSEAKPYMFDVTLSLGALALTLDVFDAGYSRRRVSILAVFGLVAVWFSYGVLFTIAGLGIALVVLAWRDRGVTGAAAALWPLAVSWSLSAAAVVWISLHGQFPGERLELYRANETLFAPLPRTLNVALWFWREWRAELSAVHGWAVDNTCWTSLYPALGILGLVGIAWRLRRESLLLFMPLAVCMLASMARQYPYGLRFALYPLTLFALGIGESVGRVAEIGRGSVRRIWQAVALALCVPALYAAVAVPPPYPWTMTGAYLARIRARWQPGDVLYTAYGKSMEVSYYAPRMGLNTSEYVLGPCDFRDPRTALRAVDRLRGKRRVWVIVDPGVTFPSIEYAYLRTIGIQRDSLAVTPPRSLRRGAATPYDVETAYLFDLSDVTRLARATADSYRLSPVMRRRVDPDNEWACRGVFSPTVRESAARDAGTTR
jgi:hypothetical protein